MFARVAAHRVMRLRRLEQMITVAVSENAMLTIDEETTSSPQRSSAHLEELNGWVRGEDEVLVSLNEHKNYDERSTDNHPVGQQWNSSRSKDRSQIDPTSDRWR